MLFVHAAGSREHGLDYPVLSLGTGILDLAASQYGADPIQGEPTITIDRPIWIEDESPERDKTILARDQHESFYALTFTGEELSESQKLIATIEFKRHQHVLEKLLEALEGRADR